jgi:hypothetical protein
MMKKLNFKKRILGWGLIIFLALFLNGCAKKGELPPDFEKPYHRTTYSFGCGSFAFSKIVSLFCLRFIQEVVTIT